MEAWRELEAAGIEVYFTCGGVASWEVHLCTEGVDAVTAAASPGGSQSSVAAVTLPVEGTTTPEPAVLQPPEQSKDVPEDGHEPPQREDAPRGAGGESPGQIQPVTPLVLGDDGEGEVLQAPVAAESVPGPISLEGRIWHLAAQGLSTRRIAEVLRAEGRGPAHLTHESGEGTAPAQGRRAVGSAMTSPLPVPTISVYTSATDTSARWSVDLATIVERIRTSRELEVLTVAGSIRTAFAVYRATRVLPPVVTCYACGGSMSVKVLQPDPHGPPVQVLVCADCKTKESVPPDIESHAEDRPRLPGF